MSKGLLLDTSAIIRFFRGDRETLEFLRTSPLWLCPIVLGELYLGAYKSKQFEYEADKIELFCKRVNMLKCDDDIPRIYGKIASQLALAGTPISPNDTWIAAFALCNQVTLLSADIDYQRVQGLDLVLLAS